MTDEEKAAVFIKRYWGTYTEAFRDETIPRLVKLIRDEREACALIAKEERDHHCKAMMEGPQSGLVFQAENGACATANTIWTRIRARSS